MTVITCKEHTTLRSPKCKRTRGGCAGVAKKEIRQRSKRPRREADLKSQLGEQDFKQL